MLSIDAGWVVALGALFSGMSSLIWSLRRKP